MTSRDNFLKIYRHEIPEYVPADGPYDVIPLPGEHGAVGLDVGERGKDWFGVDWTSTKVMGMTIDTPTPGGHAIEDITQWKTKNVIPSRDFLEEFPWEEYCSQIIAGWNRSEHLSVLMAPAGFFERLHHLMPFEEALCSFYDEPEELEAFLDALLEYKKYVIQKIYTYAKPDVVVFFDDYGTSNNLFLSEEMWLEFIAPRLKRIIDFCHELGLIFEMHSCGCITPLVKHMVDMGIDALQPLQALNDVEMVKRQFGDQIVIHGGITASELVGEAVTHQEMLKKVQECVKICAPGGNFIVMLSECELRTQEVSEAFRQCLKEAGWDYR